MNAPEILAEKQKWDDTEAHLKTAIQALMKVPDHGGVDLVQLGAHHTAASNNARLAYETLQQARKTCQHTWVNDGRDSHYDWRKCTNCGQTDRY